MEYHIFGNVLHSCTFTIKVKPVIVIHELARVAPARSCSPRAGEHDRYKSDEMVKGIGEDHWQPKQELLLGLPHIQNSIPPPPIPPFSMIITNPLKYIRPKSSYKLVFSVIFIGHNLPVRR